MSLIQSCLPVEFGETEQPLHERRKAVLTCPRCAHTSPPDGDWNWTEREHGSELHCPICEHLLTVREQFDDSDTPK